MCFRRHTTKIRCRSEVYCFRKIEMFLFTLLTVTLAMAAARPQNQQNHNGQVRQLTYSSPYPVDLQYDFSLLDPQLQYPPFAAQPRLQPQVFLYPGSAPGQPFLLQPGAPPGNFLIPQPHPGFVLRDSPQPDPSVYGQGQPRQPFVPPINKDAEEIPTGPNGTPQLPSNQGKKPEKLETFDEGPELTSSGEAEVLASPGRTITTPSLKPGHRFFILNGQPLFSNYASNQFQHPQFQPQQDKPESDFYFRQQAPSFLPEGFNRQQLNEIPTYKVPVNNFFQRNTITGQINNAKPSFDVRFNDLDVPSQNFVGLNPREEYSPRFESQLNFEEEKQEPNRNFDGKSHQTSSFKLRPIEVPDEEETSTEVSDATESQLKIDLKKQNPRPPKPNVEPSEEKQKDESVAQAEPSAVALAGPGGVASAAPKATALSGDHGLAVSSPKATAIAGPAKEKGQKITKTKKEKQ